MRALCVFGAFALALLCAAQKRNQHWIIYGNDINFLYPQPVCEADVQDLPHTIAMSDTAGNLLFYGLGKNWYNSLDQPLANVPMDSLPIPGASSIGCSVPFPGHPDQYVVLITGHDTSSSVDHIDIRNITMVVDMDQEGGLGAVIPESLTTLEDSLAFPKTAIPHSDGQDYWFLAHKIVGNHFLAYPVSAQGVGTPVVSAVGPDFHCTEVWYNGFGTLTASLDGTLLASAATLGGLPYAEEPPSLVGIYHFDAATGTVTPWVRITGIQTPAGAEFSPDGSKFYVYEEHWSNGFNSLIEDIIWQYDLLAGDEAAINASRIALDQRIRPGLVGSHRVAMGADGRLYVSYKLSQVGQDDLYLGVIEQPDSAGLACDYQRYGFVVGFAALTVPEMCKRYHDSEPVWLGMKERGALPSPARVVPNPLVTNGCLQGDVAAGSVRVDWADASGRQVRQEDVRAEQGRVPLQRGALLPGCYVVSVSRSGERVLRARVVVQ